MRHKRTGFYLPWSLVTVVLTALIAALAVAGCGGGEKSPFGKALSYVPEKAPFVIAFDTDIDGSQFKDLESLVDKVPAGRKAREDLIQEALDSLKADDVDFDKDIKPLLGNRAVLAAPTVQDLEGDNERFIMTVVTKDEQALTDLLESDKIDLNKPSEYKGADIYKEKDGDSVLAVNGPDIVLADDEATVKRAIDTKKSDASFSEDSFDSAQPGSSSDYLIAIYVNAEAFIKDSSEARNVAEKVPWVGALTTAGMTLGVDGTDIDLQYKLDTSGTELKEEDLPLASGAENPELQEFKEDSTGSSGIRDLARTIHFIETVAKEFDPNAEAEIDEFKQQMKAQIGMDIDKDIIDQLAGDLQLLTKTEGGGVILDPVDPERMQQTLQQLMPLIPSFLFGAGLGNAEVDESQVGESTIYSVSDGGNTVVEYGIVSGELLVAIPPTTIDDLRADNFKPVEKIGPGSVISEMDVLASLPGALRDIASQQSETSQYDDYIKVMTEIEESFSSIKVSSSTETNTKSIEGEIKLIAK